jgi:hypothetical protein
MRAINDIISVDQFMSAFTLKGVEPFVRVIIFENKKVVIYHFSFSEY